MKPKIKLNHINDLHDARYCSAVGVGLLGFTLAPDHDRTIDAASVAGIMEWLSGPEGVGEWNYQSPEEVNTGQEAAGLNWLSVPLDYPDSDLPQLKGRLVFRAADSLLNENGLQRIAQLAVQFPDACFEFAIDPEAASLWSSLKSEGLIERSILRFSEPDPVYTLLVGEGHKPLAFSLGEFVEEPDGQLDYGTCDDFVEQFNAMMPA